MKKMMMAKKKALNKKFPKLVEDIAKAIEEGLDRFSPEERSARLEKIHLILAGGTPPLSKARKSRSASTRRAAN